MLLAFLMVEDLYQYYVNRLLSGCADGPHRPIANRRLK
ncbi:hypothetical protein V1293_005040 [Bradyrhizobium sp. AZCC 1693]